MSAESESNAPKIERKIDYSKKIIEKAFERYSTEDLAIAWSGGKDSTLVLWLVREVCLGKNIPVPCCFCIDEGDMFDEVRAFLQEWSQKWGVEVETIHNHDVSQAAGGVGNTVKVKDLNERNQREIQRLGYEEDEFVYEPESFVGNHLMKTVPLNIHLKEKRIKAFFEGIRWDEQSARANETYFSPRKATDFNPKHMRIFPILHFSERDAWDAILQYDIPFVSLYERGYRSLGARVTTDSIANIPAWEQDLENTTERGGRRQDKEGLMEDLRKLGYM